MGIKYRHADDPNAPEETYEWVDGTDRWGRPMSHVNLVHCSIWIGYPEPKSSTVTKDGRVTHEYDKHLVMVMSTLAKPGEAHDLEFPLRYHGPNAFDKAKAHAHELVLEERHRIRKWFGH